MNPVPVQDATLAELVLRARRLAGSGGRRLLGITGPPGSGKSHLADALVTALGERAVLVRMDGFHLANQELHRLGRRDRKGAPDTFDTDGYLALLRRLRTQAGSTIYAPVFDRDLETAIGSATPIPATARLVITEGNYLLHDDPAWAGVRGALDEVWYLAVPDTVRERRLIRRRQSHGHPAAEATAWVQRVDRVNGETVERSRDRADLIIRLVDRT